MLSAGTCQLTWTGGLVLGSEYWVEPPSPFGPWQPEQAKWGLREPGSLGGGAGENRSAPRATARWPYPLIAPFCREGSRSQ